MKARKHNGKLLILSALLIAMIVIFTIISGGKFFTIKNLRNVMETTTTVSLLAIGAATLMISGQIDLSLGGIGTVGAVIVACLLNVNVPWVFAFIIGLAVGGLFGALNAVLVNLVRLPSFIVTIATASVAQGLAAMLTSGSQISINSIAIQTLGGGKIGDFFPVSLVISLLLLLIAGIMLKKTAFGRSIYMVGENPEAARLCGIDSRRVSFILFIAAGVLATLAGTLVAGKLKFVNSKLIVDSQFDGITAAILGGVSVGGGDGGMGGALIGILILDVFENGTTVVGMNSYWQKIMSGLLLVLALFLNFLVVDRSEKSKEQL
jgi:ribose transport system permease protein